MATWAKEEAWDPEVPGSNPGTARGRITSIKTKPDSPEVREYGQGLSRAPVFLHMHVRERMTMKMCHDVATIC